MNQPAGGSWSLVCVPSRVPLSPPIRNPTRYVGVRLPLLHGRPGLALVVGDGVQHHLDGIALRVVLVALGPVVTNGVGKDASVLVEGGGRDAAAHVGVALETVLGVLIPEVERTVGAGRAEGAVDGVERDIVDGVDVGNAVGGGVTVTLEGEVGAAAC